jgi:hypothetical protein
MFAEQPIDVGEGREFHDDRVGLPVLLERDDFVPFEREG